MTKEEVLFSHSNNIYSEFNESCIKYLYQGTPVNTKRNIQPIVNLLPTKTDNDRIIEWNTNAQRLSMSISNMSNLLQREFDEYNRLFSSSTCDTNNIIIDSITLRRKQVDAQNNINDLERTVVSFIARTANQIEELRRNLKVGIIIMGGDVEHHRTGVVSILVHRLRQEIVSEMSEIRKIRMNGLAKVKEEEEHKQRIEDDDDNGDNDDNEPYEEEEDHTTSNQLYHRMHSFGGSISSIKKVEQQQPTYQPMEEEYSSTNSQHYRELQAIHQQSNALTEVNRMEQTMMQVSSLLNQFSILVEEQQNDIVNVNDKAKVSKGNVEDGTDLLMDAKDRMKNSGNYMAKSIILLSFTLLFMNWIFP